MFFLSCLTLLCAHIDYIKEAICQLFGFFLHPMATIHADATDPLYPGGFPQPLVVKKAMRYYSSGLDVLIFRPR
jgi:hypothetical protein